MGAQGATVEVGPQPGRGRAQRVGGASIGVAQDGEAGHLGGDDTRAPAEPGAQGDRLDELDHLTSVARGARGV